MLPSVVVLALIVVLVSIFGVRRSRYSFRDRYQPRRREREAEAAANLPPDPAFRFDAKEDDDGLGRI